MTTVPKYYCVGGGEQCWAAKCALEKSGIVIDIFTSVYENEDVKSSYSNVVGYRKILQHANDYFFIVVDEEPFRTRENVKLIQHFGAEEFGILYRGFTKDFGGRKNLQEAFYSTLFEIFTDINLLNSWDHIENCRRAALEGAGYWDVPFMQIYGLRNRFDHLKYFEVGPGLGTMSLMLKKVMDLDVTWLNIPNEEKLWSEVRRKTSKRLFEKYDIHIDEGYIEIDEFKGKYDVIVLAQVMEHFIYNPVSALTKLRNMLSDRGALFVSVPEEIKHYNVESFKEMPYPHELTAEQRERRTQINEFSHFHEYSYAEAMEAFEMSGLKAVSHVLSGPVHHFMLEKA